MTNNIDTISIRFLGSFSIIYKLLYDLAFLIYFGSCILGSLLVAVYQLLL